MIINKSSSRLDKIVEEHCSVVASNPAIVFFSNSTSITGGFICSMIYLIGMVISAYKNVLPIIVNTQSQWSEDNVLSVNVSTLSMGKDSYNPSVP